MRKVSSVQRVARGAGLIDTVGIGGTRSRQSPLEPLARKTKRLSLRCASNPNQRKVVCKMMKAKEKLNMYKKKTTIKRRCHSSIDTKVQVSIFKKPRVFARALTEEHANTNLGPIPIVALSDCTHILLSFSLVYVDVFWMHLCRFPPKSKSRFTGFKLRYRVISSSKHGPGGILLQILMSVFSWILSSEQQPLPTPKNKLSRRKDGIRCGPC